MVNPKQAVGRPRDGKVDHAIRAATRELLDEHGYAGFTVDAVAARAGIGKAAIYRRYETKQEMIFAAVMHDMSQQPPADHGSLKRELVAVAGTIVEQLGSPPAGVVAGLLADVNADPRLAARFANTFIHVEREALTVVLDRAVARGELPCRPDVGAVHALLLGPIFARLMLLIEDRRTAGQFGRLVGESVAAVLLAGIVPSGG